MDEHVRAALSFPIEPVDLKRESERLAYMLRRLPAGYRAIELISVPELPDRLTVPVKFHLAAPESLKEKLHTAIRLVFVHTAIARWGAWRETLRAHFDTDTQDILVWGPAVMGGPIDSAYWGSLKDALRNWR